MNDEKYAKENETSTVMQYAIRLLNELIDDIRSGKCSEKEFTDAIAKFNPEVKGYVKEDDFMNYDEVGIELGMRWDRNKINRLCKTNNIKNRRFNNMTIGFPRKEILRLKEMLENKE